MVIGPDGDVSAVRLRRLARALRWDGLRLLGPIYGPEKFDYLCAADCYISLSYRENYNFTAAEAMACGLPVILSRGNDLGWEFSELGCGWQLKSESNEERSAVVREFMTVSGEALREMGERAQNWVSKELAYTTFSKKLLNFIEEIACREGRRKA